MDLVLGLCKYGIYGINFIRNLLDVLLVLVDGILQVLVASVGHLERRGTFKGKWVQ